MNSVTEDPTLVHRLRERFNGGRHWCIVRACAESSLPFLLAPILPIMGDDLELFVLPNLPAPGSATMVAVVPKELASARELAAIFLPGDLDRGEEQFARQDLILLTRGRQAGVQLAQAVEHYLDHA